MLNDELKRPTFSVHRSSFIVSFAQPRTLAFTSFRSARVPRGATRFTVV